MAIIDFAKSAKCARLKYVSCGEAGIRRVKKGRGFVYSLPNGKRLTSERDLARIRKLAIPPAWTQVWICTKADGHLQATGYDAKGRKQYRYDTRWRQARDDVKYQDLQHFAAKLPGIRRQLARELKSPGLSREKVLATAVSLIAQTGVRVGNDRYKEQNGSFGLTTLLDRHAKIAGNRLELAFRGKGGKPYRTQVEDPRLSRIVKSCRDIPGQRLFQYVDGDGCRWIDSGDVNRYVQSLGGERITAKTFRTWVASVTALAELRGVVPAEKAGARKRQLNEALARVADRLGNTLSICRKSYVHPTIMQAFLDGQLPPRRPSRRAGLTADESDLLSVLESPARARAA